MMKEGQTVAALVAEEDGAREAVPGCPRRQVSLDPRRSLALPTK
jgi:hypothetical protein